MGAGGSTITPKQREEGERQLQRRDLTRRVRERLEMVKAAALGDEVERSARWRGRARATVEHWLPRFAAGGVAALADAARAGRPVLADDAYLSAREPVPATSPSALGVAFDLWTSARLAIYREQQTAGHIPPGWLRVLLGQRGWVWWT